MRTRIKKARVELKKWLFRQLFKAEYTRLKSRQIRLVDLKNRNDGFTLDHYIARLDEVNIILDILGEEMRVK